MSRQFTREQQEEINKFQLATQQLNTLQQTYLQMENSKKEMQSTLDAIKEKEENQEVYRRIGQIMYKTTVGDTKAKLTEDVETLSLRVSSVKKQIESLEKSVKEKEAQIRASLNS